jgi:ribosomal protein S12 methylthiotransferase accessory factor
MHACIEPEMRGLAETFHAAAAMVMGEIVPEGPPRDLLARLDYLDGPVEFASHRAGLLRAAAGFHRIFALEAVDTPRLIAIGAEVNPARVGVEDAPLASVSGIGLTFRQAFESCVGEGVEYLSQFLNTEDPVERLTPDDALSGADPSLRSLWDHLLLCRHDPNGSLADWTIAADLANGRPVRLPVDICFRRPVRDRDMEAPWRLSVGCGAGTDHLAATLHGLLELIERDAVALWWHGGRRARVVPLGAGSAISEWLRDGETTRRTWLLDITSDIRVPVVVAASCDDDGFGLCCGFAARPNLIDAAAAAAREMAQMELGRRIIAAKRATRGEAALNEADQRHVRRLTAVNVTETPALHPVAPPLPPCDLTADNDRAVLAAVRERLENVGFRPCVLNLSRASFGIPVTRVICPGLEPGNGAWAGPRLNAMATTTGTDPAGVVPLS